MTVVGDTGRLGFARVAELRSAILKWVYAVRVVDAGRPYALSLFMRSPYYLGLSWQPADRQALAAWDDLRAWKLVKEWGIGPQFLRTEGIQFPNITSTGKICVERWDSDATSFASSTMVRPGAVWSGSVNLTIEEIALLEHVYDEVDRDLRRSIDVPPSASGDVDAARALATRLVDSGVLVFASFDDDVSITQFGLDVIENLRSQRKDWPARSAALRLSIVHWLYGHYAEGTTPQITEDFLTSERSYYAGQLFSASEVAQAVIYLRDSGLIEGLGVDQNVHLARPSLTAKGTDCAEGGKSVSEFLNPSQSNGPTFHVKIEGSQNVAVGTQSDFTQNNNSGIDPAVLAQLTHFATVARQGLPSYGLGPQQQDEVEQFARELEAEATGEAPERGRLRRLVSKLVAALAPTATSALGGVVTALGEQAVTAISG